MPPKLSKRRNIIVIADEAHRSQWLVNGEPLMVIGLFPGFLASWLQNSNLFLSDSLSFGNSHCCIRTSERELPKIDEEFEAITEGEELTRKENGAEWGCCDLDEAKRSPTAGVEGRRLHQASGFAKSPRSNWGLAMLCNRR